MKVLRKFFIATCAHFRRGVYISLVLGALLTTLVLYFEEFESLSQHVESLYPKDHIFIFLLSLFGMYLFISLFFFLLKFSRIELPESLKELHSYSEEIGMALQGVLLAFAGGAVAYVAPMLLVDFGLGTVVANVVVFCLAFGALCLAAIMGAVKECITQLMEHDCKASRKVRFSFPSYASLMRFIISRKARSRVSSEDKFEQMEYWIFVQDGDDLFAVEDKKNKSGEYLCRKVRKDETEEEKTKYFELLNTKSKRFRKATVQVVHGSIILKGVSPLLGVIQVLTLYPFIYRFARDLRWRWIGLRDKRAYEQFSDRLKVLEALIFLRNENVKNSRHFSSSYVISDNELRKYIASNYQFYPLGYQLHVEPIIEGFIDEGLVSRVTGSRDIRINGKAWSAIYDYYTSDRRHKDSLVLSRWQIIMALVLTLVTAMTLFKDELPSIFEWLYSYFQ